ncbi:hypothetical protein JWS14_40330 [Rhodococcus koreensis]|nr:hypothetical protein JWS14_40330 [Rhodococcus koreensis]
MNREDNELLEFAAQWAPFGGASAGDVFETFGMTLDRYHRRLRQILRARGIHPPIDGCSPTSGTPAGTVFTVAREIVGRSLGERFRIEAAALSVAVHNGIEYGLMQAYAEGYELSGREPRITAVDSVMRA